MVPLSAELAILENSFIRHPGFAEPKLQKGHKEDSPGIKEGASLN